MDRLAVAKRIRALLLLRDLRKYFKKTVSQQGLVVCKIKISSKDHLAKRKATLKHWLRLRRLTSPAFTCHPSRGQLTNLQICKKMILQRSMNHRAQLVQIPLEQNRIVTQAKHERNQGMVSAQLKHELCISREKTQPPQARTTKSRASIANPTLLPT